MQNKYVHTTKRKKSVLAEDEYTKAIEAIIERDFFPDIPILKRKLSTIPESPDTVDPSPAGELFTTAQPAVSGRLAPTPALTNQSTLLETPVPLGMEGLGGSKRKVAEEKVAAAPTQSLDCFLSQFTSEDNASFTELQEESLQRKRMKVKHLLEYRKHTGEEGYLLDCVFNPKNRLFYDSSVTGTAALTQKEVEAQVHGAPREICHENTRFLTPIPEEGAKLSADYHLPGVGIVDLPEREILMTPTPLPGRNLSPIMTWGELAGTPVRLDSTPGFTIKDASERDLIGRKMARNAKKAIQQRNQKLTPSGVRNTPTSLSAAGRKLASQLRRKTPGTDLQLRATYSGTPRRRSTRSVQQSTPLYKMQTPTLPRQNGGKLTDNLLD